jgi:hypothetical protein
VTTTAEYRAKLSLGTSGEAIYRMVAQALTGRHPGGGTLLDAGCGIGQLWAVVSAQFDRYAGVDAIRYDGFPDRGDFRPVDVDTGRIQPPSDNVLVVGQKPPS